MERAILYNFFTGVDPSDYSSYNNLRTNMVKNYLSSLIFTLYYYNESCPSYSWYYKYCAPPLFSDIYTLTNIILTSIQLNFQKENHLHHSNNYL